MADPGTHRPHPVLTCLVVLLVAGTQCAPSPATARTVRRPPRRRTSRRRSVIRRSAEAQIRSSGGDPPADLPMLLVGASGGGSKSAYWTHLSADCTAPAATVRPRTRSARKQRLRHVARRTDAPGPRALHGKRRQRRLHRHRPLVGTPPGRGRVALGGRRGRPPGARPDRRPRPLPRPDHDGPYRSSDRTRAPAAAATRHPLDLSRRPSRERHQQALRPAPRASAERHRRLARPPRSPSRYRPQCRGISSTSRFSGSRAGRRSPLDLAPSSS